MQIEKEIPINNSTGSRQILNAHTALSSHTFCCEVFLSSSSTPSKPFLEVGAVPGNPASHVLWGKAKHSHCHFSQSSKVFSVALGAGGSGWTWASSFQHRDQEQSTFLSERKMRVWCVWSRNSLDRLMAEKGMRVWRFSIRDSPHQEVHFWLI